jgi:hypothetical protein
MAKSGFGYKCHDLKYLEVGFFFIYLELTINLRTPIQTLILNDFVMLQKN